MNVPVDEGRFFNDAENSTPCLRAVLAFNVVEALFRRTLSARR
jgi:hypothetical protein